LSNLAVQYPKRGRLTPKQSLKLTSLYKECVEAKWTPPTPGPEVSDRNPLDRIADALERISKWKVAS
jgi:hypothetical protein